MLDLDILMCNVYYDLLQRETTNLVMETDIVKSVK